MLRIALFLVMIPLQIFAQQVLVPHLGSLCTTPLTGSAQGMAIYQNRAVLLRHGGQCVILDLMQQKALATYNLDGNKTHCNNASFAATAQKGREFPLLYVSSCYGDKACYVTQISSEGSNLVQRIFYDSECFKVAQDWCVDAEEGYLYAYGGKKGGTMYLKQFVLPSPTLAEVHLTDSNVLSTTPIKCVKVAQGSKIYKGYAYLPDGDEPGQYYLHIVELGSGQEVQRIDLNSIGLEPEGVDVTDEWIYISFNSPDPINNCIYRFPQQNYE